MTHTELSQLAYTTSNLILERIIRQGEPLTIVDSPPGAGKTWIVERLVALATGPARRRVLCTTNTNSQARDLVARLARFRLPYLVQLVSSDELANIAGSPARVTNDPTALPSGPGVVVATLKKVLHSLDRFGARPFDLVIIDEAYQANGADVQAALSVSQQFALIGDPGQLDPVIISDTKWFEGFEHRVHLPAPQYLLDLDPSRSAHVIRLPASRRLVQDTVNLVQPAFYPDLPFGSLANAEERRLHPTVPGFGTFADHVISLVEAGASIVQVLLPATPPRFEEYDSEVPVVMAQIVGRMLARGVAFRNGEVLDEEDFACIDPNVASGEAVRQALRTSGNGDVRVDTPEKWQGLQRSIAVVKHPLTEMIGGASFGFNPGRWCVSLSRHTHACIVVGRASIGEKLDRYVHSLAEAPCEGKDVNWQGYAAHKRIWDGLAALDRNVPL